MHPRLLFIPRALWLGFFNADQLNEITRYGYEYLSGFEREDFNIQQGLWDWEEKVVQTHLLKCKHILVTGAGGGREVIALARRGISVKGIDFSRNLVNSCIENISKAGVNARVFVCPPEGFPVELAEDFFDGIVIGRGFYHHIPERKRRIAFLTDCWSRMENGSPLFLSDFFTRSENSRAHYWTQRIASIVRRAKRNSRPAELGDWLSYSMQHAFTRDEIESELKAAGFSLKIYAISPFNSDSHLAHAVAYK